MFLQAAAPAIVGWADLVPQIAVALAIIGSAAALAKLMQPKGGYVSREEFGELKQEIAAQDEVLADIRETVIRLEERSKRRSKQPESG